MLPKVYVHVDSRTMGVGGYDRWEIEQNREAKRTCREKDDESVEIGEKWKALGAAHVRLEFFQRNTVIARH